MYRENFILNQAKRNNEIVYGAQSVKKQLGVLARSTFDYDIYSRNPKRSAVMLTRTLNRASKSKDYYNKPALYPRTKKVMHVGVDRVRGTRDDLGIVDYTVTKPVKTVKINGIKYSKLSETVKDKRKSLGDLMFKFRHRKDKEDLQRIKIAQMLRRKQ